MSTRTAQNSITDGSGNDITAASIENISKYFIEVEPRNAALVTYLGGRTEAKLTDSLKVVPIMWIEEYSEEMISVDQLAQSFDAWDSSIFMDLITPLQQAKMSFANQGATGVIPGVRQFTFSNSGTDLTSNYMQMLGYTYKNGDVGIAPAKVSLISDLANSRLGAAIKSKINLDDQKVGWLVLILGALFVVLGAGQTSSDLTSTRSVESYASIERGEIPGKYQAVVAVLASIHGTGLKTMDASLIRSLSRVFSTITRRAWSQDDFGDVGESHRRDHDLLSKCHEGRNAPNGKVCESGFGK